MRPRVVPSRVVLRRIGRRRSSLRLAAAMCAKEQLRLPDRWTRRELQVQRTGRRPSRHLRLDSSPSWLPSRCARSAARFASGARRAVQPHARKHVDLTGFGTIRSRSANNELTHESRRNQADGRLNRTLERPDASAVCNQIYSDAEGSDATGLATRPSKNLSNPSLRPLREHDDPRRVRTEEHAGCRGMAACFGDAEADLMQ